MELKEIPLKNISFLENIRQRMDNDDLSELMGSIKHHGLFQPIGVRELKNNEYLLVWGFRRYTACKKLGYKTIPAMIFKTSEDEMTEQDFLIANATENIQRKDVNAIELGRICESLKATMSIDEIAVRLNISKSRVRTAIETFNRVPQKHRGKVKVFSIGNVSDNSGAIGSTIAGLIVRMRGITENQKERIFDWALKEKASLRKINLVGMMVREDKMTLGEILKEADKYDVVEAQLIFKKDKLNELREKGVKINKLVADAVRKQHPDLLY